MKIYEDREKDTVHINDKVVPGKIDEEKCKECGNLRIYHDDYDAYFCAHCNIWIETKCFDPFCEYCKKRPKKPI
ncbi:MAG: hypothetical protein JRG81_17220 [Deltaproteobacteria bacterium]|nr:hypothetical protein [Deltaproteobacteria bacterium]MBW2182089.1 hypothetical protein [Deltaproteobacteria bacterium]MBW2365673.1 hypothetical protein [Deltaproteobacteria bacterium]